MASVAQALIANGANGVSSIAAILGSNVTAGSRIVVVTFSSNGVVHTGGMVTDTLLNTYVLDFEVAGSLGDICFFSAPSPAGGANTVTYNPAVSGRLGIIVAEVSGIGAYVATQTNSGTGTSVNPATGAITPAAANGITFAQVTTAQTITWETDYATGAVSNGTGRVNMGFKLITTTDSEEATATIASSTWNAMIIRYPDAAGGGGGNRRRRVLMAA